MRIEQQAIQRGTTSADFVIIDVGLLVLVANPRKGSLPIPVQSPFPKQAWDLQTFQLMFRSGPRLRQAAKIEGPLLSRHMREYQLTSAL